MFLGRIATNDEAIVPSSKLSINAFFPRVPRKQYTMSPICNFAPQSWLYFSLVILFAVLRLTLPFSKSPALINGIPSSTMSLALGYFELLSPLYISQ